MGYAKDPMTGKIYETDAGGNPIREVSSASPPQQQGRIFTLPPNPKDVRTEQRQEASDRRSEEDQRMQREAAARSEAQFKATHNADGSPKESPSASKPTEFQSKSAYFLGRMMQSEKDFAAVPEGERGGRSMGRQALHDILPSAENTFVNSPDRQKADQAVENFIAASLRQESGAAIGPTEFTRQYKIFFPSPGDGAGLLAQKANARRQAMEGFKIAAGPTMSQQVMATIREDAPAANGAADFSTYQKQLQAIVGDKSKTPEQRMQMALAFSKQSNRGVDPKQIGAAIAAGGGSVTNDPNFVPPSGYEGSTVGQGLSGVNEGIASTFGGPVDLANGAINLATRGINSLANANIPKIENPILGSQWIKDHILAPTIYAPTDDPTQQFARRVGQSVGASVVPAGMAGSLGRAGMAAAGGLAGGIGGATAQQVAPGNPYAEMAGEVLGGGLGAGALNKAARNASARQIEAAVPTVDQLKEQAGGLYRQAEARGIAADPTKTQNLADQLRAALSSEGSVSPTGRISEVYPKAKEAMQLADDYAGQTMSPTQLQTVRKVVSDGLSSKEKTDRRLAGILTDTFDQWAAPLAPELPQAREIASRYLTAEQLGTARELAGARAGQFTGSGYENALRTEYRGLDRGAIKGTQRFGDDVTGAIENVARGTSGSNFARALGRFAPRGPVSAGLGMGIPALMGGSVAGPPGAIAASLGAATIGELGRSVATNMGIKAANQAELIARNGGMLPIPNGLSPEAMRALGLLGTAESAKYLSQRP